MNIAIIGTGNIGTGLAQTFASSTHGVVVAGSTETQAKDLATKLNSKKGLTLQAADVATAVKSADIIFLAVPFGAVADIAQVAEFTGKVVVDVTNPVKEDFSGLTVGFETSAAEKVAKMLPGARVVKGFNTVFAQVYEPGLKFGDTAVPVFLASDDDVAKSAVMRVASDAGFDPVDAGPLSNARYIEPLAYLNIQFGYMLGLGTQIAPAWLTR
ncbi:MAG: NADPH-dependent F420 reductase [Pseudomonadota bacterium]